MDLRGRGDDSSVPVTDRGGDQQLYVMSADGGDCETVLDEFATAGIDIEGLAASLQEEGAKSFVNSWNELMDVIDSKCATLAKAS